MRRPIIGADPAGDGAVSSSGDLPDVDAFTWLPLVGDLEAYKDGHLDHLAAEIYVEMNTELKAEGLADGVAPELAYEATVCIEAASRLERDRSALRMASHKPRRLADRELYAARAAAAERAARQARDVRLGARVVAIPIGAGPGVPRGTHFRLALVALRDLLAPSEWSDQEAGLVAYAAARAAGLTTARPSRTRIARDFRRRVSEGRKWLVKNGFDSR